MHTHLHHVQQNQAQKTNHSEFSNDLCYYLLKDHPFWHGNMLFPKKCSDLFIQGSPFTPGIGLHHFPRAPEATVTHGSNGRVKGEGMSAGLGPKSPLQTLPPGVPRDQQDPHTGILGFLSCLEKMRQTKKQTTELQLCVSGRDGDFKLTQQNLIPWTQQILFCQNSVILSLQSHFLSIPTQRCCFVLWLTGTLFPANHRLHTRNVLDVQGGKIWQSNTKKRDINSLELWAV